MLLFGLYLGKGKSCTTVVPFITPPEETEHGTRPGGRGPGGRPRGCGLKNREGGHVRVYRGGLSLYRGGSIPCGHFACVRVVF